MLLDIDQKKANDVVCLISENEESKQIGGNAMDGQAYFELKKKEEKTEAEWELLKTEGILRTVSEFITDADKHDRDPRYYIDRIREYLRENDY